MKVVTIRSIKGGAGKTTLATNLLGGGRRTVACLIDIEGNDSLEWMQRGGRYRGHVVEVWEPLLFGGLTPSDRWRITPAVAARLEAQPCNLSPSQNV